MSAPVQVEVVRAQGDVTTFVQNVITLLIRAWIVMLLLPMFTPWNLSYLDTLAASLVIGTLFSTDSSYLHWTRRKETP